MKQSTLLMRLLTAAIAIVAAVPAWGQSVYDPKIAYTSFQGKTDSLMVANAIGTNPVAIYKVTSARLGPIDMAPIDPANATQRRVAFVEAGVLKVLTYQVSATGIRAIGSPLTLDATGAPYEGIADMDFSPDGSKILYSRRVRASHGTYDSYFPREIRLVSSTDASTRKVLLTVTHSPTGLIMQPRWLNSTEFAFLRGIDLPYSSDVQLAELDANENVSAAPLTLLTTAPPYFLEPGGIEGFDVARGREALLLTVTLQGNRRVYMEYRFDDESLFTHFSDLGWQGRFANANTHIVYLHNASGISNANDFVQRYDITSGNTVKLTSRKGLLGFLDTQP